MKWHVTPRDQGQTVEVAYASDCECYYWRRTTDRSDQAVTYERLAFDDAEGGFEPWNGIVPTGEWEVGRLI